VIWPITLPPPLADGYSEAPKEFVARTNIPTGLPVDRTRATVLVSLLQFRLYLTDAQRTILDAFYTCLPFTWTDPVTGQTYNARFVSRPTSQIDTGVTWFASVSLELLA
jgi:hypothetical protein